MKAFLATCIAGAIAFSGMIYLVGGSTRRVTVPDVVPVAMPDVAASFTPAVPGRFPMSGFPDDRVAQPSHQDAAPDADAGAEKAAAPVLASVGPEPTAAPQSAPAAEPVSLPAAVSGPSLTTVEYVPTNCNASIDASRAAQGTQDFRYLICYVWSELPPTEKPAATSCVHSRTFRSERRSRRSSARPTRSAWISIS